MFDLSAIDLEGMFTMKLTTIILRLGFVCIFGASLGLVACKSKSGGGKSNKPGVPADPKKQLTDPDGSTSTTGIKLAGKSSGETIQLSSSALDTASLTIQVEGIAAANLVVGLLTAPQNVVLLNQSGSYRLGGSLTGVGTSDITILARDKSKCTASDCSVNVDTTGRFPAGQVTPNTVSDYQGQFKLQLTQTTPPLNNGNSGGTGLSGLGDKARQFGSTVFGSIKNGFETVVGFVQDQLG